jgi:hypothetical protein
MKDVLIKDAIGSVDVVERFTTGSVSFQGREYDFSAHTPILC